MDFYHFFPPPIFWLKVCSRSVCWKYVNKQVKRRWFCWRTLEYGYFDILKRNKFKNKSKKIYFFLDGLAIKKTTFSAAFLWDIHFYFKILNQTKILPSICEKKSSWSRLHFFFEYLSKSLIPREQSLSIPYFNVFKILEFCTETLA